MRVERKKVANNKKYEKEIFWQEKHSIGSESHEIFKNLFAHDNNNNNSRKLTFSASVNPCFSGSMAHQQHPQSHQRQHLRSLRLQHRCRVVDRVWCTSRIKRPHSSRLWRKTSWRECKKCDNCPRDSPHRLQHDSIIISSRLRRDDECCRCERASSWRVSVCAILSVCGISFKSSFALISTDASPQHRITAVHYEGDFKMNIAGSHRHHGELYITI